MVEPFERLIISFGKTIILVEGDNADGREFCFQHLDRVIGRTVICYDNLRPFRRVGYDGSRKIIFSKSRAYRSVM